MTYKHDTTIRLAIRRCFIRATRSEAPFFLALYFILVFSRPAAADVLRWHPSTGLYPGASVDRNDATKAKPDAIDYDSLTAVDVPDGAAVSTDFSITQIHSTRQLHESLNIDASLEARFLFFGGGGSVSSASTYDFDTSSLVWVLHAFTDYGRFRLAGVRLKPEAQALSGDGAAFERRFGSSYVYMVRRAALVSVIYSVESVSAQSMSHLQSDFDAGVNAGVGKAGASGGFKQFINKAATYGAIHFHFYGTGGPGAQGLSGVITNSGDFDATLKAVADYVDRTTAATAPPYEFHTIGYDSLGIGSPQPDLTVRDRKLHDLMYSFLSAQDQLQRLSQIIVNAPTTYAFIDRLWLNELTRARDLLIGQTDRLRQLAQRLETNSNTVVPPEVPIDIRWPRPTMNLSFEAVTETKDGVNYEYTLVGGPVVDGGQFDSIKITASSGTVYDLTVGTQNYTYLINNNLPILNAILMSWSCRPSGGKVRSITIRHEHSTRSSEPRRAAGRPIRPSDGA